MKSGPLRAVTATVATASIVLLAACSTSSTNTATSSTAATSASTSANTTARDAAPQESGLIVYVSRHSFSDTVSALRQRISDKGTVTATVDFAALASKIGKQLRPTTVVIGGNPSAVAPVVAADQRTAIDLPQKYLVWQAAGGTVFVAYNSADYIAQRAGLAVSSGQLDALRTGSAAITSAATGSTSAAAGGSVTSTSVPYLVEKTSNASVTESIARYAAAFTAKQLPTVATVDLAAAGQSVGVALRPTMTILVGNPTVSTALLSQQQTMGIDLPVRYSAWQDADGVVHVAHPDYRGLAARHSIPSTSPVLAMVDTATSTFTNAAAGTGN